MNTLKRDSPTLKKVVIARAVLSNEVSIEFTGTKTFVVPGTIIYIKFLDADSHLIPDKLIKLFKPTIEFHLSVTLQLVYILPYRFKL